MLLTRTVGPGNNATARPRRFYGWRIVGTLAVTETVSWGVLYYAFSVFVVPMQTSLGFSRATLTGAFSVTLLLTGLTAVPVGRWLDRHGGRALMTAGACGAVSLVVAWSQVRTVLGLYATFAGIGVVSAMVLYEPAFAIVVRWFKVQRSQAMLAVTVVAGFASTIFLPTTQALIDAYGWRHALLILAGVLAVFTVVPHAVVLRRAPADLGLRPDGVAREDAENADWPVDTTSGLRMTARWAVRAPTYRWLTWAFTANTAAVIVVTVHLVPLLRDAGHSASFAATVTGGLGILSVTGRLAVTRAGRRWSTAQVTATAFIVQALAAVLLLSERRSGLAAVLFVAMFGLGFGVGTIARPALLAQAYGAGSYATLAALMGLPLTAAKVATPVLAGIVVTATGSYTAVLVGIVGLCLLASGATARAGQLIT